MASNIKLKRSAVPGKIPLVGDLDLGEVAINTNDGKVYIKINDGTDRIREIGYQTKFDAIVAPTVNNDITEGYVNGSFWYDTVGDKLYMCTNNADGAAAWEEVTLGDNTEVGLNSAHRTGDGTDHAMVVKHNFSAVVAPTTSNDSSEGYEVGSQWFNVDKNTQWACLDNTVSSANWKLVTEEHSREMILKRDLNVEDLITVINDGGIEKADAITAQSSTILGGTTYTSTGLYSSSMWQTFKLPNNKAVVIDTPNMRAFQWTDPKSAPTEGANVATLAAGSNYVRGVPIGTDKFAQLYNNSGGWYARICSLSGVTISTSTSTQAPSSTGLGHGWACEVIGSSDKFVLAFDQGANSYLVVGDTSGATVTFGTPLDVTVLFTDGTPARGGINPAGNSKILAMSSTGSGGCNEGGLFTVSGNSITSDGPLTTDQISINYRPSSIILNGYVILHSTNLQIVDVSGATPVFAWDTTPTGSQSRNAIVNLRDNIFTVLSAGSGWGVLETLEFTAPSTITLLDTSPVWDPLGNVFKIIELDLHPGEVIMMASYPSISEIYHEQALLYPEVITQNFTMGVLQESGSAGEAKMVEFLGGISTIHSGLTIGADQFIDDDGIITEVDTGYQLGTSISTTSILLNTRFFEYHLSEINNPHSVTKSQVGLGLAQNVYNEYNASIDPTANDDIGSNFTPGSTWYNSTDDKLFVCVDNTSTAAVWSLLDTNSIPDVDDSVKDSHIDWGTGGGQVSADDIPDGSTNAIVTLTQETNFEAAYTHITSDGTSHANVVLNDTHRGSDGVDDHTGLEPKLRDYVLDEDLDSGRIVRILDNAGQKIAGVYSTTAGSWDGDPNIETTSIMFWSEEHLASVWRNEATGDFLIFERGNFSGGRSQDPTILIGNYDGTTLIYSINYLSTTGGQHPTGIAYDSDQDRFVVMFQFSGGNLVYWVLEIDFSTRTITTDSGDTDTGMTGGQEYASGDMVYDPTNQKIIVALNTSSQRYMLTGSITLGTPDSISWTQSNVVANEDDNGKSTNIIHIPSVDKILYTSIESYVGPPYTAHAWYVDASGGTPTLTPITSFLDGGTREADGRPWGSKLFWNDAAQRVVIAGSDTIFDDIWFVVGDPGASDIVWSDEHSINELIGNTAITISNMGDNRFVAVNYSPNPGTIRTFAIHGNSLTLLDERAMEHNLLDGRTMEGSIVIGSDTDNAKVFQQEKKSFASPERRTYTETYSAGIENFNIDGVIGILQETGTSGQSKPVALEGHISTIHSGLTISSEMYVQGDGTISETITDYPFGIALSDTEILIGDHHSIDYTLHFTQSDIEITASQVTDIQSTITNNVDVAANTVHSGITTGNPHQVLAAEVTTADASGYFTATDVEDTVDELHELKEPKHELMELNEDLTQGDLIRLIDDAGTTKITGINTTLLESLGSLTTLDPVVYGSMGLVYDPVADRYVFVYHLNDGGITTKYRVARLDTNTQTFTFTNLPANVLLAATRYWSFDVALHFDPVHNKIIVAFSDSTNSSYLSVMSGSVNPITDTMTWDDNVTVINSLGTSYAPTLAYIPEEGVWICKQVQFGPNNQFLISFDFDGTAFGNVSSYAMTTVGRPPQQDNTRLHVINGKLVYVYTNATTSLVVSVHTYSGTTRTGSTYTNHSVRPGGALCWDVRVAWNPDDELFMVVFRDRDLGFSGNAWFSAAVGLNTTTFVSTLLASATQTLDWIFTDFYDENYSGVMQYHSTTGRYFFLATGMNETGLRLVELFESGGTTSWASSATSLISGSQYYGNIIYEPDSSENIIATSIRGSNGDDWDYIMWRPAYDAFLPEDYAGVLQETGTTGQIKKVAIQSRISYVHSGLTTGSDYYIQTNGTIGLTETEYPAGVAFGDGEIQVLPVSTDLQTNYYNHVADTDIHFEFSSIAIDSTQVTDIIVSIDDTDSPYTATARDEIYADTTTDVISVLVPATPAVGDKLRILDSGGTFATNNLTIDSNGTKIKGSVQDIIVNVDWSIVELFYTGDTNGWTFRVFSS